MTSVGLLIRLLNEAEATESEAKINACKVLFLAEIQELGGNRLRLVVHEGRAASQPRTIAIGAALYRTARRSTSPPKIRPSKLSGRTTLLMPSSTKSYASQRDAEESYTGTRFRTYSKSHFRNYLSRRTFATDEYPGPMRHFEICCEDQIVNAVSLGSPAITLSGPLEDTERGQIFRM